MTIEALARLVQECRHAQDEHQKAGNAGRKKDMAAWYSRKRELERDVDEKVKEILSRNKNGNLFN